MQTEQNTSLLQHIADFTKKNKWYSSILSIIVGVFLYLIYKIIFLKTFFSLPFISDLLKFYIQKLLFSAESLLKSLNCTVNINYDNFLITVNNSVPYHFFIGIFSLGHVVLFLIAVFFIPVNRTKKIIALIVGMIALHFFYIVRLATVAYFSSDNIFQELFFHNMFQQILSVIVITFIYLGIKKNKKINEFLTSILEKYGIQLKSIFVNIISLKIILSILFFYGISQFLAKGVLIFSHSILSGIGYATLIDGLSLKGIHAQINMIPGCIGLNMIGVFSILILISPAKSLMKFYYIFIGTIIIYLSNVLRICLIYYYFVNHHTKDFHSVHDFFTYPVYIVIFIMWVIWINKFVNFSLKEKSL